MIFKDNIGGGKRIKAAETTLDINNTTFTIPKGRHNGKGVVHIQPEEKTVKPSNVIQNIRPTDGRVLSQVIVDAIEGDAEITDVKQGKTFASSYGVDLIGNMPVNDSVMHVLDADHTTFEIKKGYHDGNSVVSVEPVEISTALSTSDIELGGQGILYSKVHVLGVPGTAINSDVLKGKKFSSASAGINENGTMENYSYATKYAESVIFTTDSNGAEVVDFPIPSDGFYNTKSKIRTSGANVHPGTADPSKVLSRTTFSSDGYRNATGTMNNYDNYLQYVGIYKYDDYNLRVNIPNNGYYTTDSVLSIKVSDIQNVSGRNDGKFYLVGKVTGGKESIEINISSIVSFYAELNVTNFFIVPISLNIYPTTNSIGNKALNLVKSYDSSTGILKISGNYGAAQTSYTKSCVWNYGEGFSDRTFYGGA